MDWQYIRHANINQDFPKSSSLQDGLAVHQTCQHLYRQTKYSSRFLRLIGSASDLPTSKRLSKLDFIKFFHLNLKSTTLINVFFFTVYLLCRIKLFTYHICKLVHIHLVHSILQFFFYVSAYINQFFLFLFSSTSSLLRTLHDPTFFYFYVSLACISSHFQFLPQDLIQLSLF